MSRHEFHLPESNAAGVRRQVPSYLTWLSISDFAHSTTRSNITTAFAQDVSGTVGARSEDATPVPFRSIVVEVPAPCLKSAPGARPDALFFVRMCGFCLS